RKAIPSSVARTGRWLRSMRVPPRARSSEATCVLTRDWARCSARAAAEKLPWSMTATKVSSQSVCSMRGTGSSEGPWRGTDPGPGESGSVHPGRWRTSRAVPSAPRGPPRGSQARVVSAARAQADHAAVDREQHAVGGTVAGGGEIAVRLGDLLGLHEPAVRLARIERLELGL